jgi:prevent-host-death family protein
MEVSVSALRSELKSWLGQAKDGHTVVITERGIPVAKLVPVAGAELLEELEREGLLAAPSVERPPARFHQDPAGAAAGASAGSGLTGLVRRLRR